MRVLLFIFMLLPSSLFLQNKEDVLLKINSFNYEGDSALLSISIFNKGAKEITCYKVGIHDICSSVLKIKAKDDFGNIYEVFPFDATIDLESIYLDCDKTVKLLPNEGFVKVIKFAIKDFSPHLRKGSYELFVEVNYSIGNFETKLSNVLETDLLSKKYHFQY